MRIKMSGSTWLLLGIFSTAAFKPAGEYAISSVSSFQKGAKGNYRIYHKSSYRIVDTAGFYLYNRYVEFEHTKGKGLIRKDEYYFSQDSVSVIRLLTIENLKLAYPGNHRFHYDIDAHFKSDNDLIAYDPFTKMYKLKYLYLQSLKD